MKMVSQLFLVILAVAALTACGEQGKGPAKPVSSASTQVSQK
jgi:predicted small lipoprotein YifL